jgi:hypothetical protein
MQASQRFRDAVMASNFVQQLRSGVLTVDNSEFSTWDSCAAMGLYYGGLRRVATSKRTPLTFGGAVHVGLDHWLNHHGREDPISLSKKALALALADAAANELDAAGDPKRNSDRLDQLLSAYFLQYDLSPSLRFKVLEHQGKRMVEQSFTVPLGAVTVSTKNFGAFTIQIIWAGKIDVIEKFNAALAVVDHKTTTVMGDRFTDDKERSSQMVGYTYAGRYLSKLLFDNQPVFGARINALAMRSTGFEFQVFDIPIADWKVAEWQMETLQKVERVILDLDNFISTGVALPTREHCCTKYGRCQYFDLCNTHPSMRDRMLFDDNYFFISEWSPLD